MRIKELAEQVGISPATIRFYETKQLLQPARKENKYRCYSEKDVEDLKLILALKQANFSLKDIEAVIELKNEPSSAFCKEATMAFVYKKQIVLEEQIEFLLQVKKIVSKVASLVSENSQPEEITALIASITAIDNK